VSTPRVCCHRRRTLIILRSAGNPSVCNFRKRTRGAELNRSSALISTPLHSILGWAFTSPLAYFGYFAVNFAVPAMLLLCSARGCHKLLRMSVLPEQVLAL